MMQRFGRLDAETRDRLAIAPAVGRYGRREPAFGKRVVVKGGRVVAGRGVAASRSARLAQLLDGRFQRLALDQLHGEEMDASLLADGIDWHDVRVVELCSRLRFDFESGNVLLIQNGREWQDLQRDRAIERQLPGLVDNAHAAAANLANQLEVAEAFGGRCKPP